MTRVSELDDQIKGGTTVALAVIKHNDLFVANVGDTRVLLCMVNPTNRFLLVDQVSRAVIKYYYDYCCWADDIVNLIVDDCRPYYVE